MKELSPRVLHVSPSDSFVSYQVELDPSSLEMKVSMKITGSVAKGKDEESDLERKCITS